jgi:hypothetical protein
MWLGLWFVILYKRVGLGLKGLKLGTEQLFSSIFRGYFQTDCQLVSLGAFCIVHREVIFGMLGYLWYLFGHGERFFKVEIGVEVCLSLTLVMTL